MKYRRFLRTILLTTGFFVIVSGVINFTVDPLQFYRKAKYPPVFSENQRYQNPGLARNYDYDTIILGTSLTENFLPSYINKQWNCSTVKLSMSGSTLKEEAMLADVAFRTGKVNRVLWSVEFESQADQVNSSWGPFPYYLYDENPFNDVRYLLSGSTLKQSVAIIRSWVQSSPQKLIALDLLGNWQERDQSLINRKTSLEAYQRTINRYKNSSVTAHSDFEKFKQNIDENVINVVKNKSNIQFILFFPPYSMPYYKLQAVNECRIDDILKTKRHLVESLIDLPNVKIYDFQTAYDVTYNLDNYKDPIHYSQDINQFMIDQITLNNFRVTRDHYLINEQELKRRIAEYQF